MDNKRRIINIVIGLALFILISVFAKGSLFTQNAAIALATMALMIFWWITKPVHLAVTALLPVIVTSIFGIVPINTVLDDYASPIVVLLLGANILTLTWGIWGLDKRIALRMLILIGTSFRQQLIVWFLIATVLSAFLPNAVVAAALCPIAISMINHCVKIDKDLENSNVVSWILIAIVWGAGLGGFGTPLGGAMNLVAIEHIENALNAQSAMISEYTYMRWTITMLPYLIALAITICLYFLFVKLDTKKIAGSKEYFKETYKTLGKMSKGEMMSLVLFALAILLAFTRPLYSSILPTFKPPYAFLIVGAIALFVNGDKGKRLIEWNYAAKNINWSLMILFSGGMAAGNLLIATKASSGIAQFVTGFELTGILSLVLIFVALGMFLSNTSSNTAATSVLIPIVLSIVPAIMNGLAVDALPFVYVSAAACNAAFILPTSIRAIPVGYGLDTKFMMKKGAIALMLSYLCLIVVGYIAIII